MPYHPKSSVSNHSSSQQVYLVANNSTAEEFVAPRVRRQTTATFIVVLMNEYKYFTRIFFLHFRWEKLRKTSRLHLTLLTYQSSSNLAPSFIHRRINNTAYLHIYQQMTTKVSAIDDYLCRMCHSSWDHNFPFPAYHSAVKPTHRMAIA